MPRHARVRHASSASDVAGTMSAFSRASASAAAAAAAVAVALAAVAATLSAALPSTAGAAPWPVPTRDFRARFGTSATTSDAGAGAGAGAAAGAGVGAGAGATAGAAMGAAAPTVCARLSPFEAATRVTLVSTTGCVAAQSGVPATASGAARVGAAGDDPGALAITVPAPAGRPIGRGGWVDRR